MSEENMSNEQQEDNRNDVLQQMLNHKQEVLNKSTAVLNKLVIDQKFDRKDVVKLLASIQESVLEVDRFLNLTVRELKIVDQRFLQVEQQIFNLAQSFSVVSEVLRSKELVTNEEAKVAWEEVIKPKFEKSVAAMKNELHGEPEHSSTEEPAEQAAE